MNFQEKSSSGALRDDLLSDPIHSADDQSTDNQSVEACLLPEIFSRASETLLKQVSPAAFAYLGDAVYELHVRVHHLLPPKRIQLYHDRVVAEVRAEAQANYLRLLQPHLTDQEREILKRGRNASPRGPKRLDPEIYRQATSLEALLGYLYLANPERLTELLRYISSQQTAN